MEAGVSSNLQNAVSTACTIFATQFSCQKKKKKGRVGNVRLSVNSPVTRKLREEKSLRQPLLCSLPAQERIYVSQVLMELVTANLS